MRVVNCEQGSPEWKAARAGHVTASCQADVMAQGKSGEAATRRNYRIKLVAERLTGSPCERGFKSKAMEDGNELEPFARAAYESSRELMVDQVGFVLHPTIEHFGASPDGLVGDEGMIEIKCGIPSTHVEWLLAGKAPAEHQKQMLAGMACCERKWCDFVSYCPEMPEHLQLFVVRFWRDDQRIREVEEAVVKFNAEVEETLDELNPVATLNAQLSGSLQLVK